jgi:prepilin-type N-terminal cleavage/methylation domain-containing protein
MAAFKRSTRGFTLTELVIVVAIISLIALIAIPNFLESKKSGNEASAIASMRTIFSAESIFFSTAHGVGGFSYYTNNITLLAGILDETLVSGNKAGYSFKICSGNKDGFTAFATPQVLGSTGDRSFYVDETGVIRAGVLTNYVGSCPPASVMQAWPGVEGGAAGP